MQFKRVAVGGTFDELHRGHKALLTRAFEVGGHVVIGLTSDTFVSKLHKTHQTSPYNKRLNELMAYLQAQGLADRADVEALNDPFGSAATDNSIDAIVVSKETYPIAEKINQKRKNTNLSPLEIVTVGMVPAENHVPISTTRICGGEIDREGHLLKTRG
ncbi:MAG: phosphopantetheine adenylyltransferase [Candidatus Bathyarchaeota archaeon]|nr:phosphopantetheine adenylyltransferase [Candidatus Bathyarchaeota archaeon]